MIDPRTLLNVTVALEALTALAAIAIFRPGAAARRFTVPVELDLQWDDEHMPRFEAASAVRFLERHLRG